MAALYRRGGFGYGEVKKALADAAEKYFGPAERKAPNWRRAGQEFVKSWPTARPSPPPRPTEVLNRAKKPAASRNGRFFVL